MTTNDKTTPYKNRNNPNLNELPPDVLRCYEYSLKGLNAPEIAKLLEVSARTVQRWKKEYNLNELAAAPPPDMQSIQYKAYRMAKAGLTYTEIGTKLNRSKATIYNYVRAEREKEQTTAPETAPGVYQPLFDYLADTYEARPLVSEMDEIQRICAKISAKDL